MNKPKYEIGKLVRVKTGNNPSAILEIEKIVEDKSGFYYECDEIIFRDDEIVCSYTEDAKPRTRSRRVKAKIETKEIMPANNMGL